MIENVTAYTLVDITHTNTVHNRSSNTHAYHQMQNLLVLLQIISLRTQPMDYAVSSQMADLKHYDFFHEYSGMHRIWSLSFHHEHPYVWSNGSDRLFNLKNDAHGVAITSDLDNTIYFNVDIFNTQDRPNLYFVC